MADFGKLPNFFIIGAAKSGTTTLYDVLKQHPQVYLPVEKEPQFFSQEELFGRGAGWYEETFFKGARRYPARGEATPHYLYWGTKVAPRLKDLYGNGRVKFIVSFRDPVKRAYSWYWNMVREGREDLSFAKALSAEGERIEKYGQSLDDRGSMIYGYFRGGCYAAQLRPFLELFPREDFLLLLQEDIVEDLEGVMAKVFGFIGVDSSLKVREVRSNPATMPRLRILHGLLRERSALKEAVKPFLPRSIRRRTKSNLMKLNLKETSYPPLDEELELALRRRYRDEIEQLQRIMGRDLSRWMIKN